jgi:transposase
MADRAIDGTVYRPVGELQGASKLTAAAVAEIRASGLPQKALAERFGVSKQQISKIIRRERWAHV